MQTAPATRRDSELADNPDAFRRERVRKLRNQVRQIIVRKAIEEEVRDNSVVPASQPFVRPRIALLEVNTP